MRPGSVDRRVQGRVVIHLELTVELEASLAIQDLLPQPVQCCSQIIPLFRQNPQAFQIACCVALRCPRTVDLFAGMKKFK